MSDRVELYDGKGTLISVVDNRVLADVKLAKWNEINVYRDVVLGGGIWLIGYNWGSDAVSRANITGAVAGAVAGIPLPPGFTWRDNNNNNIPFDVTMLITLGGNVMAYVNEVYNASWDMKSVIDDFDTLEEVDNFTVSAQAWPDGNMDGTMPIKFGVIYLPPASVGVSYNQDLEISGGIPPYTASISSGALPTSMSLSNSSVVGNPTVANTYVIAITVVDSTANTALTGSQTYTLTVN
jgi:hypothetical protein